MGLLLPIVEVLAEDPFLHMTRRIPSVFTGASTGPNLIALGVWNLSSSMPCPSGVRIIARVGPDILEPNQAPDQRPFDCRLALELEAQFDEKRLGGFEIVDNDEDVVHPFNRHLLLPCKAVLISPFDWTIRSLLNIQHRNESDAVAFWDGWHTWPHTGSNANLLTIAKELHYSA